MATKTKILEGKAHRLTRDRYFVVKQQQRRRRHRHRKILRQVIIRPDRIYKYFIIQYYLMLLLIYSGTDNQRRNCRHSEGGEACGTGR